MIFNIKCPYCKGEGYEVEDCIDDLIHPNHQKTICFCPDCLNRFTIHTRTEITGVETL